MSLQQQAAAASCNMDTGGYGSRRSPGRRELFLPELMLQFHLRTLEPRALGFWQGLAGAIDIEGQHRQRGAVGTGLAPRTMLRGPLERRRYLLRARQFEHALLHIDLLAFPPHPL